MEQKFAEKIIHTQVNTKPNQTKQKVTVFEQKQTNKLQSINTKKKKKVKFNSTKIT